MLDREGLDASYTRHVVVPVDSPKGRKCLTFDNCPCTKAVSRIDVVRRNGRARKKKRRSRPRKPSRYVQYTFPSSTPWSPPGGMMYPSLSPRPSPPPPVNQSGHRPSRFRSHVEPRACGVRACPSATGGGGTGNGVKLRDGTLGRQITPLSWPAPRSASGWWTAAIGATLFVASLARGQKHTHTHTHTPRHEFIHTAGQDQGPICRYQLHISTYITHTHTHAWFETGLRGLLLRGYRGGQIRNRLAH